MKDKVSVNDVLEALAIRTNDILRPDKKSKNKKNNAYFWAFKLIYLICLIFIVNIAINSFEEIGVSLIYGIAKSLRSVLSAIWIISLSYIKGLIILYLLFDNLLVFTSSKYYEILYENNRKLKYKKELVFKVVELILKIYAVFFMIAIAVLGAVSIYGLVTILLMLFNNVYVISPIVIFLAMILISYFTFMHIRYKFFGTKQKIYKNHFLYAFIILVIGVLSFAYETSSYEHFNALPDEMELTHKETSFELVEGKKINLKNYSKLNNLEIIYDDNLDSKMIVKFDYFETAEVRYSYTFNEDDNLNISFSSRLDLHPENLSDIFKMLYSTFNRKIIYNYNLFKYPNIYVYVNSKYKDSITLE